MGSKTRCKTFSTEFFDWQIQSKKSKFFDWIPQWEYSVEKALFRLCKKARFGLQSKKAAFSTDKSDRVRNGLTTQKVRKKSRKGLKSWWQKTRF